MSDRLADAVGLLGSAVFIAAFVYANWAGVMDKRLFNAANLVGAILLLTSLSVHFNLAAVVLETAWGLIAAIGLFTSIRSARVKL